MNVFLKDFFPFSSLFNAAEPDVKIGKKKQRKNTDEEVGLIRGVKNGVIYFAPGIPQNIDKNFRTNCAIVL